MAVPVEVGTVRLFQAETRRARAAIHVSVAQARIAGQIAENAALIGLPPGIAPGSCLPWPRWKSC